MIKNGNIQNCVNNQRLNLNLSFKKKEENVVQVLKFVTKV